MEPGEKVTWIRAGVVAGFVATVSYVFLVVGSGGAVLGVAIASLFGLALGLAAIGLWRFLSLTGSSVAGFLGMVATLIASATFTSMAATRRHGTVNCATTPAP